MKARYERTVVERASAHVRLTPAEKAQYRAKIKRWRRVVDLFEEAIAKEERVPDKMRHLVWQASGGLIDQYQQLDWLIIEWNKLDITYRERLRQDAKTSLSAFAEYMNPDEPPAPHHEWLCTQLEGVDRGEIMQLIISMPPGHAKSTYCSHLFPAWYMGRHPNNKYIQAGHTQDFVEKEFGLRVKTIIESPEFQDVFPGVEISASSKASGAWNLKAQRGRYVAKGIGQGISGYRGNIAAIDDPYAKRADAESPAMRKGVFDWFMSDLLPRLLPKSPVIVIATRWHPLDLCGVLEDRTKKGIGKPWKVVNLAAICEDPDDALDRPMFEGDYETYMKMVADAEAGIPGAKEALQRAQRAALWADFYTLEWLLEKKASLPPRDWNSLYRGKPVDENGGVIQSSWLFRYENLPDDGTNGQNMRKRTTLSVDCASKDGQRNDYTVITIWIEDTSNIHYLAQVYRGRWQFEPMVEAINAAAEKWHVQAILVEDKGAGTQYIQTQAHKAPAPVIAISTNNDSKQFRFDGVTPMFQAGEVLIPHASSWLADYESELLGFPGAAHDDQVDSTSQYLAWARKKRSLGTKKLSMGSNQNHVNRNEPAAGESRSSQDAMMHVQKDGAAFAQVVQRMAKMGKEWARNAGKSTPSAKIDGGIVGRQAYENALRLSSPGVRPRDRRL
jgi:predicted phage terminase large subunit-like protein